MPDAGAAHTSVQRLLRVISKLNDAAQGAGTKEPSLVELIACSHGIELRNPAVLRAAGAILELPRQVAREIAEIDAEQARYAEPGVRVLVDTLSPENLQASWTSLYSAIEPAGLPALAICSLLLDGRSRELAVDESQLSRLAEDARDLLSDVRDAEQLPLETRRFVESALLSLLEAIDEYWVKGVEVVENAIDVTIGRAIREQRFKNTDDSNKPVMKRLGVIMVQAALIVGLANDVHELPETVSDVVQGIVHIVTDEES